MTNSMSLKSEDDKVSLEKVSHEINTDFWKVNFVTEMSLMKINLGGDRIYLCPLTTHIQSCTLVAKKGAGGKSILVSTK